MSGIPFMVTSAMKTALRARGFVDADIELLTPEDAHKILMTPDERAGLLGTCRMHPNDKDLVPVHYRLDDPDLVDRMTHDAVVASEAKLNVYIEGRLVDPGLRGKKRGELKDTVCVYALVVDSDADKGMGWIPPAGMRPTLTVETSPNNAQFWFFFERALSPRAPCIWLYA